MGLAACDRIEIDGLLHLLELQYDATIAFWFGVAEVTDITPVGQIQSSFIIEVTLDDGREGKAHLHHGDSEIVNRLSFVGVSPLQ